jgi:hypothetical protein
MIANLLSGIRNDYSELYASITYVTCKYKNFISFLYAKENERKVNEIRTRDLYITLDCTVGLIDLLIDNSSTRFTLEGLSRLVERENYIVFFHGIQAKADDSDAPWIGDILIAS